MKNLKFELKHGRKPKTALMGLAFKPNIDDLRDKTQITGGKSKSITKFK
jgi:UDP-glucose 6-dehydrogenase